MAISSILRQISYPFNTTYNFLLVNFVSVKKKEKTQKRGEVGGGGEQVPNPPPTLDQPLGSGEIFES